MPKECIKTERHIKTEDGYKLLSQWTAANSVEYGNGLTVENIDWMGTRAEFEADLLAGKILDGMNIIITDDTQELGLKTIAFTADYKDLENVPFVPTKASDIGADVAGSASSALSSAKSYTDSSISNLALGDASKKTVTSTIDTSTNLPTSAAIKEYVDNAVAGASNYLGTITTLTGLSTSANKGDFYRVSTAWSGVHVGDIIMAEKNNPSQSIDGINWSLMHNEINTDTTYTFTSGINQFTVTPSNGSAQTVTVTPSIAEATTSKSGLLSSEDKTKINSLKSVATTGTYDSLTDTWYGTKNQYKTDKASGIIKEGTYVNISDDYIQTELAPVAYTGKYIDLVDKPTAMPASDVYSWAKQLNKPSYNYNEISGTPSSLPASDVYAWAKESSRPSYTALDVNALSSSDPTGSGSFSLNRKANTTIGYNSFAEGHATTASGNFSHAEGYMTTASGFYSHAEGYITTASGFYSHAEGSNTTASGEDSHAEGSFTTASGGSSHAEGLATTASGGHSHAEGMGTTASGEYSHAEGDGTTASGEYSHAEGYFTEALTNQHAQGHYNNINTATANSNYGTSTGTAFVIGNGTSASKSNAFRVTGEGVIYAANASVNTGADYAEYFEWADGNVNEEDRVGRFVTFDNDNPDKIKYANDGDYILGIVSGMPSVIGNGDECWKQRYILDEFGRYIEETFEYEVVTGTDEETKEEIKETKIGTKWKENPDYDQSKTYTPRAERAEWDAVGMMGVLSVYDDGTCQVNGYCKCGNNGTATANESGYRVIGRVSDNIIKVVLR